MKKAPHENYLVILFLLIYYRTRPDLIYFVGFQFSFSIPASKFWTQLNGNPTLTYSWTISFVLIIQDMLILAILTVCSFLVVHILTIEKESFQDTCKQQLHLLVDQSLETGTVTCIVIKLAHYRYQYTFTICLVTAFVTSLLRINEAYSKVHWASLVCFQFQLNWSHSILFPQ